MCVCVLRVKFTAGAGRFVQKETYAPQCLNVHHKDPDLISGYILY